MDKDMKTAILSMWGILSHIENMLVVQSGTLADFEIAHMNAMLFQNTIDKFSKEVKKDEQ